MDEPRDAMLRYAMALRPSVCPSQVGVLSKRRCGSRWFWPEGFFRQCCKDIQVYAEKLGHFPLERFPKLWT